MAGSLLTRYELALPFERRINKPHAPLNNWWLVHMSPFARKTVSCKAEGKVSHWPPGLPTLATNASQLAAVSNQALEPWMSLLRLETL